jgi:hypothetical protein
MGVIDFGVGQVRWSFTIIGRQLSRLMNESENFNFFFANTIDEAVAPNESSRIDASLSSGT